MSEYDVMVDARGKNCPLPILMILKAMDRAQSGQVIEMHATDPGSVKDVEAYCRKTGHQLVSSQETFGEYVFVLKKK